MYRNTQKALCAQQLPCDGNRQTIATQMDADSLQRQRKIDPIIDEELGPVHSRYRLHLTRKRQEVPG